MTEAAPFPDARTLLRKYGLHAKKSFGQNFLVSERVYRAIVDAVVSVDNEWIVEIGAGLGTLTARLAERVPEGKVFAVERDRDLVGVLAGELGHYDNVDVVEANALSYDISAIHRWCGEPIAVCGNLPYNIASQILFHVLEHRAAISRAVVMLQKEMADRLVASPGTKAYGALGVMLTTYADIRTVVRAGRTAFSPQPRVDSAVVRMIPLAKPRAPIENPNHYSKVVHAAFGQRRKMLRNALAAVFGAEASAAGLDESGIDGMRRGETLTIDEFAALAAAIPSDARAA